MTHERKMLIFMATQDMVDFHTEMLSTVLGTREKKTGEVDEDSDLEDEYGLLKKKDENEEDDKDPSLVDIEFFKLHGNMTQKERTDVFKTFRSATSGVLLCTVRTKTFILNYYTTLHCPKIQLFYYCCYFKGCSCTWFGSTSCRLDCSIHSTSNSS